MDRQNFSPFYRTLSPTGAAALLPLKELWKKSNKRTIEQGKGTGDHLMLLGNWLRKHNLLQQKLKRPERKLCVYFTMEILRNLWTHWDTKDFARKLPPAWLMFSLMFSHLLLLHQNFIVSGYSTRFVNGKAVSCYQMNGVGRKLTRAGHQFQQMCLQPQKNFSKSSGATVIPTVVVKDAVARSMVWSAL